MVRVRVSNSSPIILLLVGILFIAIGIGAPLFFCKEAFISCNEVEKGFCLISEKGLIGGESIKKFPADQIIDVYTKEHVSKSSSSSSSRNRRRNRTHNDDRVSYTYSIHMKLKSGEDIQFPPNTSLSSNLSEPILNQLTSLKNSGGKIPMHLTHDSKMFGLIFGGIFGFIGVIMILSAFFGRR